VSLSLQEWIETVDGAYLSTFIKEGGSAIKVAVQADGRELTIERLRRLAGGLGYVVAVVDASQTKVHLVDQLFFAVSRQVGWEALAARLREQAIVESAYKVGSTDLPTFESIAEANDVDPGMVRRELEMWFTAHVLRDPRMSQEFRHAMATLCLEPFKGPVRFEGLYQSVLDWLTGDLRLISALRPAQIFQKVTRTNARDLFISLGHWSRKAKLSGLVIIIDIAACATARRSESGGAIFYNRSMTMALYEVLRQFIDSTDDLDSVFMTVVTAPEFLTDDSRGLAIYDALRMRVAEEVRDRTRENPLATLVRLEVRGQ